ncbi:nucleolin-like isoform X2 [Anneissia japonica]|nr:nucleolin-like isoform X2 [Anneissia japonica]XP_033107665.1 nucleolin-like isoform X2 [Anneissia japonica]
MVKKEVKQKEVQVKKSKSNKTNKNTSEDLELSKCELSRTKQKKTKKQTKRTQKVVESEEEYKLPKLSFECNDENAEQAMSASFIEVFEGKDQQSESSVVSTKTQIAAEESKKKTQSKEKSSKVAVQEKKAVKRKQNKENDDVETKKKIGKEYGKSVGGKKRKQNEIDELTVNTKGTSTTNLQKELGNIRVEPGTISIVEPKRQRAVIDPAVPKQQGRSKKRKTNMVETEKNQTKEEVKSNESVHSEGQILLNAGNLPSGCDTDALNFFFNESDLYPQINFKKKSVTIKNEKGEKRRRNVNKGSAILICKSQAEADAILKLDGVTITSVTGEESEIKISQKESSDPIQSATKLYIGGLHPKIPEEELKGALEGEGISLIKVKRVCWKGTRRHKGYGFIWLPTPEDVKKALAAKITLEGKQLVITHCK